MRCFVCSDIHQETSSLTLLLQKVQDPINLIMVCGDLTNWGNRADSLAVLKCFGSVPVVAVPGNLDTSAVLEVLEEYDALVHAQTKKIGEWTFVGIGGGSMNNVGDILFNEQQIVDQIAPILKKVDPTKTVFLSHQPPYNTKLDCVDGKHVGSKAIREVIEKYQPAFFFCGHIHQSWGEEKIGKSRCYNVAAVKEGRAAIMNLTNGLLSFLSI